MIMHPQNPFVPTFHANLRYFCGWGQSLVFRRGFDLTPFYPFMEDVIHWHTTARDACAPFGKEIYPKLKAWCDDYFFTSSAKNATWVVYFLMIGLKAALIKALPL